MARQEVPYIIPDIVSDPTNRKKYQRGKFLGKGGFARCYELIELPSKTIFAGKVIAKAQIKNSDQKEKMSQEIHIHRSIKHKNIVNFFSYFEDTNNIYIVLELCSKRSLMEMHKRRKVFSEPEIRYMVRQIALACHYLHSNKIVHRDLKLGNLFLNEDMEVKVGDFGLATKITADHDRKLTLCGTPNYIAPEVLMKKGHGFEVDVWSLGCIVYTLFVGKPPFETSELKDTYRRIRNNDYEIPAHVPQEAKLFIQQMLRANPKERPSMEAILKDSYLTKNYIPSKLPQSCLTMAPRFTNGRLSIMPQEVIVSPRRPLVDKKQNNEQADQEPKPSNEPQIVAKRERNINNNNNNNNINNRPNNREQAAPPARPAAPQAQPPAHPRPATDFGLRELFEQLQQFINARPEQYGGELRDDAEDPASVPIYWISKWVDYTDRYGIGYQLCDSSIGILFNDVTRILLLADGHNLHYIERDGTEHYHTLETPPECLRKKITLLRYFRNYMNEHLLQTGHRDVDLEEKDELSRIPYLNNWSRTRNAIIFHLTNGSVQMNFFQDHTKLILCPHLGAITYVNQSREFRTYRLSLLQQFGCTVELHSKLRYARDVINRLMTQPMRNNGRVNIRGR